MKKKTWVLAAVVVCSSVASAIAAGSYWDLNATSGTAKVPFYFNKAATCYDTFTSSVSVLNRAAAKENRMMYYGDPSSGDPDQTNVLAIQNLRTVLPSAIRFLDCSGNEMGAIGYSNQNPVPYGDYHMFIGISDLDAVTGACTRPAKEFRLINSGYYSGGCHSFMVFQSSGNGDFSIYQQSFDDDSPPVSLFSRASDGNIGIKTETPSASLEVNGTFNADGAAVFYSSVTVDAMTADRVVVTDGSKYLHTSAVTGTELSYVAGGTSQFQAQINAKAPLASPSLTGNIGIGSYGFISSDSGGVDLRANNGDTAASTLWFDTNSAHRLSIDKDGYLTAAGVYNRTDASAANVYVDSSGNLMRSTSSKRYKADIRPYTPGLSSLLSLNPVSYVGKNDRTKKRHAGFLAEDVDKVGLKEFVVYDDNKKPDALEYGNMNALIINAIKELNARITALEKK